MIKIIRAIKPSSPIIRTSDVSIIISLTSFSFLAFYSSILPIASCACGFRSFAVPFQSRAVPCAPLCVGKVATAGGAEPVILAVHVENFITDVAGAFPHLLSTVIDAGSLYSPLGNISIFYLIPVQYAKNGIFCRVENFSRFTGTVEFY